MPVYNGEKYLREAIDSILNQTFTDFEFLIIDDGSTDKSAEIAKSFIPSVKYYYQPNSGSCSSPLNYGIKLSQGDFLAFLDSDDLWLKDRPTIQTYLGTTEIEIKEPKKKVMKWRWAIKYKTTNAIYRFKRLILIII